MNIIKFLSAFLSGIFFAFMADYEGKELTYSILVLVGLVPLILGLATSSLKKRLMLFLAFSWPIIYETGQGFWFSLRYFYAVDWMYSVFIYMAWIWIFSSFHWLVIFGGFKKIINKDLTHLWLLPVVWVAIEFLYSQVSIQSKVVCMGSFMPVPHLFGFGSRIGGMFATSYVILWMNSFLSAVLLSIYKKKSLLKNYGWMMTGMVAVGLILGGYFDQISVKKTPKIKVALLQPNVPFRLVESGAIIQRRLDTLIEMSREAIQKDSRLIIWPASIYKVVDRSQMKSIILSLKDSIRKKIYVSLGAARIIFKSKEQYFRNVVYLINSRGKIEHIYEKQKLTPYTEYLPCDFINLLNQKRKVQYLQGYGKDNPFKIGKIKWGNAICIEIFYPEILRRVVNRGINFLVHLSNDDVYGPTNLQMIYKKITCMRAFELGIPILRESITGITCVINRRGMVEKEIASQQKGILYFDFDLVAKPSFYAKHGDLFGILCVMISLVFLLKKILKRQSL